MRPAFLATAEIQAGETRPSRRFRFAVSATELIGHDDQSGLGSLATEREETIDV
jgi:hypothetical protein